MIDHAGEGSGFENKLLGRQHFILLAGRKTWRREIEAKFASGATMLIDLWSEETIQFMLESSKTSKETTEVYTYSTLQVSSTFYLVQFDNSRLSI